MPLSLWYFVPMRLPTSTAPWTSTRRAGSAAFSIPRRRRRTGRTDPKSHVHRCADTGTEDLSLYGQRSIDEIQHHPGTLIRACLARAKRFTVTISTASGRISALPSGSSKPRQICKPAGRNSIFYSLCVCGSLSDTKGIRCKIGQLRQRL